MHTIFALATARGKSGVAVIRISGPAAHEIGSGLAGALPPAGQAGLRVFFANLLLLPLPGLHFISFHREGRSKRY